MLYLQVLAIARPGYQSRSWHVMKTRAEAEKQFRFRIPEQRKRRRGKIYLPTCLRIDISWQIEEVRLRNVKLYAGIQELEMYI